MSEVTITGDRQAGKSFMLLALAEKLIRRGQYVAYVAQTMSMAQHHFYQMEHDLIGDHAFSFRRKNGEQRIMHGSGGTLFFSSGRSDNLRGVIIDTLILDDGAEYSHPTAQYVYRAVLGE